MPSRLQIGLQHLPNEIVIRKRRSSPCLKHAAYGAGPLERTVNTSKQDMARCVKEDALYETAKKQVDTVSNAAVNLHS
jgi:hypothetical protein